MKAPDSALAPVDRDPVSTRILAVRGDQHLVLVDTPDAGTADGYLRLTAHILIEAQRRAFTTLGVISAAGGEGKTTAAVNLAACLGRTRGRAGRVLLVDGDTRKRTLTRLLCGQTATTNGSGTRHPMLVATAFEGVDLMTAPVTPDGMTLHDPAAWAQTLHELRSRYSHILIDCPALADNPEALVLKDCVEELVLVVRAGQTTRRSVERLVGDVGRRVIGVVLNGGERSSNGEAWR